MTNPDFDSGKGYYWMKQTKQAIIKGTRDKMPRVPKEYDPDKYTKEAKEKVKHTEYWNKVENRLSRRYF